MRGFVAMLSFLIRKICAQIFLSKMRQDITRYFTGCLAVFSSGLDQADSLNVAGHNCPEFRYESNGMFVLGVGFFSSDKFRLFN